MPAHSPGSSVPHSGSGQAPPATRAGTAPDPRAAAGAASERAPAPPGAAPGPQASTRLPPPAAAGAPNLAYEGFAGCGGALAPWVGVRADKRVEPPRLPVHSVCTLLGTDCVPSGHASRTFCFPDLAHHRVSLAGLSGSGFEYAGSYRCLAGGCGGVTVFFLPSLAPSTPRDADCFTFC